MNRTMEVIILSLVCSTFCVGRKTVFAAVPASSLQTGEFEWIAGEPVLQPRTLDGVQWIAVKDPSVVRYRDKWHLFCTVRGIERSHAVIYVTFDSLSQAKDAGQQLLKCHQGYFCAPQVFYFTPHKKWYILC